MRKYEENIQNKVHARSHQLLGSEIDTFLKIKKRMSNRRKLLAGAGNGHANVGEGGKPKSCFKGMCNQYAEHGSCSRYPWPYVHDVKGEGKGKKKGKGKKSNGK